MLLRKNSISRFANEVFVSAGTCNTRPIPQDKTAYYHLVSPKPFFFFFKKKFTNEQFQAATSETY